MARIAKTRLISAETTRHSSSLPRTVMTSLSTGTIAPLTWPPISRSYIALGTIIATCSASTAPVAPKRYVITVSRARPRIRLQIFPSARIPLAPATRALVRSCSPGNSLSAEGRSLPDAGLEFSAFIQLTFDWDAGRDSAHQYTRQAQTCSIVENGTGVGQFALRPSLVRDRCNGLLPSGSMKRSPATY